MPTEKPKSPVELLTTKEVAVILKTTPGSLRKGRSAGLLPQGTRIPGLGLRWTRAEIDAWIRSKVGEEAR